jgi:hypothetical protein
MSSLNGASLVGTAIVSLVNSLATGFSQALLMANITTINPSVGTGSGIVTVIPSSGILAFNSSFSGSGMVGVLANVLSTAIAVGLDTALTSAIGTVVISGAAGSSPGAGVGSGFLS